MSKSPSLRRIQADVRELALEPSDRYHAAPLEEDMFEWHFTIRGADDTDFAGGIYHGRILLPPEYPFKPPHIMFITKSGRFETNTKICLSFSAYHPELWQPAWGIRLILEALISFLPTPADGAIGALDWTSEERKKIAKQSQTFVCPRCGPIANLLPELKSDGKKFVSRFQKEIDELMIEQKVHDVPKEKGKEKKKDGSVSPAAVLPEEQRVTNDSTASDDLKPLSTPNDNECTKPTVSSPLSAPSSLESRSVMPLQTTRVQMTRTLDTSRADSQLAERSWLTDPMLHGSIVTLAAIVFLLYRKVESLLDELRELEL